MHQQEMKALVRESLGLAQMVAPAPVRPVCIILKQLDASALNEFGRNFVDQCFRGFLTPRTEDDPDVVEQSQFFKQFTGIAPSFDSTRARRFAGDLSLDRGRYYTLCHSDSGDDSGTLINELRTYYNPFSAGLIDIFDTTVPDSRARLPQFVAEELSRHASTQRPGHLVLVVRPLGGKPFPMASPPFAVALPLKIQRITIERVIDLRVPESARWFARNLSTLTWTTDGTAIRAFPLKPPLSSFRELLPSLLMQAIGGGMGATQIAGLWLRNVGVEALIYSSARADARVRVVDGALEEWSGWNLVDYRGAEAPMSGGVVDVIPCWPTWIAAEPRDTSGLDRPIIFTSAVLESSDEGQMAGSWSLRGLQKTRSALVHTSELLFCLSIRMDLHKDSRMPHLYKLMMFGTRHAPAITMPPWTEANVLTEAGVEWQEVFCAGLKDIFFGNSILGNFGSSVFGDKRSRELLETWINTLAVTGIFAEEIAGLIDVLREIAGSYSRPYGPSLFFDADVLSGEE